MTKTVRPGLRLSAQHRKAAVARAVNAAVGDAIVNPFITIGNKKALLRNAKGLAFYSAPQVGFEPTTLRLTAACSAVELLRKNKKNYIKSVGVCKLNMSEKVSKLKTHYVDNCI